MRIFLFITLFLAAITEHSFASGNEFTLKVMTYNIHGLPALLGGNSAKNLKAIKNALKEKLKNNTAPDIIFFQEAFSATAQKTIKKLIGKDLYPFSVHGPIATSGNYNSGITILSKYPITKHATVTYGDVCATWDCKANKGAVLARLKLEEPPVEIDLINSHLQAETPYDKVRMSQIDILREFFSKNFTGENALIMGGDLNIKPERESFAYFKKIFNELRNTGEFCLKETKTCKIELKTSKKNIVEKTKDHLFYFPGNQEIGIEPVYFVRNFSPEVDQMFYSDHRAYEAHYRIRWQKP